MGLRPLQALGKRTSTAWPSWVMVSDLTGICCNTMLHTCRTNRQALCLDACDGVSNLRLQLHCMKYAAMSCTCCDADTLSGARYAQHIVMYVQQEV